jgi:hypothetical protein
MVVTVRLFVLSVQKIKDVLNIIVVTLCTVSKKDLICALHIFCMISICQSTVFIEYSSL